MLNSFLRWLAGLSESKVVDAYQKLNQSMKERILQLEERLDKCEATHRQDKARIDALGRKNAKQELEIIATKQSLEFMQQRMDKLEAKLKKQEDESHA